MFQGFSEFDVFGHFYQPSMPSSLLSGTSDVSKQSRTCQAYFLVESDCGQEKSSRRSLGQTRREKRRQGAYEEHDWGGAKRICLHGRQDWGTRASCKT